LIDGQRRLNPITLVENTHLPPDRQPGWAGSGRDYGIASGSDYALARENLVAGQYAKPFTTKGTKVHEGKA